MPSQTTSSFHEQYEFGAEKEILTIDFEIADICTLHNDFLPCPYIFLDVSELNFFQACKVMKNIGSAGLDPATSRASVERSPD